MSVTMERSHVGRFSAIPVGKRMERRFPGGSWDTAALPHLAAPAGMAQWVDNDARESINMCM